jgi:hypothetical protein
MQTDGHDESNRRFLRLRTRLKLITVFLTKDRRCTNTRKMLRSSGRRGEENISVPTENRAPVARFVLSLLRKKNRIDL